MDMVKSMLREELEHSMEMRGALSKGALSSSHRCTGEEANQQQGILVCNDA